MDREPYLELLLGCGHSRVKKIASVDGNPNWRGLVTLDNNVSCNPDVQCDLDGPKPWDVSLCGRLSNTPLADIPWYSTADAILDDAFDEVHAYEVLEHLGHQGYASSFFGDFSEIWRILKPGGHLMATVPSRFSPWLWGDPSHRRAILPESLVFLDQAEYSRQLDGPHKTPMSDFRNIYRADFKILRAQDDRTTFSFVLEAVKPTRCSFEFTSKDRRTWHCRDRSL